MKVWHLAAFALSLVWLTGTPGLARTIALPRMTCPLGGEEFDGFLDFDTRAKREMQYSHRPLGAPWSLRIQMCPNGFPMYKEHYTPDELSSMAKLIQQAQYKALPAEPTHIRLWWVRKMQGADAYELTEILRRTTSDMGAVSQLRKPFFFPYLVWLSHLPWSPQRKEEWYWSYMKAADSLRMDSRFSDAAKLLSAVSDPALMPRDGNAQSQHQALTRLVAEQNNFYWPVTLDTPAQAVWRCTDPSAQPLSKSEVEFCQSREVRREVIPFCTQFPALSEAPPSCSKYWWVNRILPPIVVLLSIMLLFLTVREPRRHKRAQVKPS